MNCCAKTFFFFFLCLKLFRNKYIYIHHRYIHQSHRFYQGGISHELSMFGVVAMTGVLVSLESCIFECVGSAEGVFVLETKSWNSELGRTTVSYCMQTLLHTIFLHEAGPLPISTLAATHLTRAMQLVCGGGFLYEFLAPLSTMHRNFVFQHAGNVPSDRNGASFLNC